MDDEEDGVSPSDVMRRMNWQAVGALLALMSMVYYVISWSTKVDERIAKTQESIAAMNITLTTGISAMRADTAEQLDRVAASLRSAIDGQRENEGRLERRIDSLDSTLNQLLIHQAQQGAVIMAPPVDASPRGKAH